jgi:hypothetical protein
MNSAVGRFDRNSHTDEEGQGRSDMAEMLTRNFGEWIGFMIVGGGLLIGLIAVAGGIWSDVRKKEIAAALKHDMLERGMSADDICKVLEAGTKRSRKVESDSQAACCG